MVSASASQVVSVAVSRIYLVGQSTRTAPKLDARHTQRTLKQTITFTQSGARCWQPIMSYHLVMDCQPSMTNSVHTNGACSTA